MRRWRWTTPRWRCMRWLRRCLEVNRRSTADTRESANCFETYTRLSQSTGSRSRRSATSASEFWQSVSFDAWHGKRGRGRVANRLRGRVQERQGDSPGRLLRPGGCPRSRRGVGVAGTTLWTKSGYSLCMESSALRPRARFSRNAEVRLGCAVRHLCRPGPPHKPRERHSLQESLRSAGHCGVSTRAGEAFSIEPRAP